MSAIWIRSVDGTRWCRLVIVGAETHGTACILGGIDVTDPVMLSSAPPADEMCAACRRDAEARQRARVPTVDLLPRTRGGDVVEVSIDAVEDAW